MKFLKLSVVVIYVIALTSCSSNEKKVQNKWWYKISSYGDDIIMFSEDGKAKNLNDDKLIDYKIDGNSIYLGKDTTSISRIDEKYLTLSLKKRALEFRLAEEKDFLIGEWKGTYNGERFEIRLKKDKEYKSRMNGDRNEGNYKIENNILKVDNDKFNYTLSEDLNNLSLTSLENEKFKIELYRDL